MIDIHQISVDAIDESLGEFLESTKPNRQDGSSETRIYKALMTYSQSLLERYHTELQRELSKHGINL